MTAKYDWPKIKEAYLASDVIEVKEFLTSFLGITKKRASNGDFGKATKGWRDEKEQFKLQQTEAAKNEMANNPDVQDMTEKLIKAKQQLLEIATNGIAGIHQLQKDKTFNVLKNSGDIAKLIAVIKTELGEPTSIAKNENQNFNRELKIIKQIIDEQALDSES